MFETNVFNAATLTRCIVTTLGINLCGALHGGVRVRAMTATCALVVMLVLLFMCHIYIYILPAICRL
jgi:hypothetical protein